ncbi:hypothetical protein [Clostridium hydrogeniformans]|uniref:hypothetical protein n=1 Tax=Clostridium hydrogeniformans TaxID=349933 RepID=UPI000488502E|nr:hypothetical protein [Clostridium hydrogeniformans]
MNNKVLANIIFTLLLILVPIFSIESIVPWIIFIVFLRKSLKTINSDIPLNKAIIKCSMFTILAFILGLSFNYMVKEGTDLFVSNFL